VEKNLEFRTKHFALELIDLVAGFSRSPASDVVGRQVLRAATELLGIFTTIGKRLKE